VNCACSIVVHVPVRFGVLTTRNFWGAANVVAAPQTKSGI
jgi:hypothetical protein